MTPVLPPGSRIRVCGADGRAVDALAEALALRLRQRGIPASHAAVVVLGRDDAAGLPTAGRPCHTLLLAPGDGSPDQEMEDARLRTALAQAGVDYAVVHGRDAAARLAGAWRAIERRVGAIDDAAPGDPAAARGWAGGCERCSDPRCEHRLFTDLIAARGG